MLILTYDKVHLQRFLLCIKLKIMKRFFKWIKENINFILVFLLIIVIALYVIYFAESVSDKAVNLLLAIGAVVSTFFLFLAFRQSKLSNELKINEPFLQSIEKRVTDKETKAKQVVMVEFNKELGLALNMSHIGIEDLTFSNFLNPLYIALDQIQNNTIYSEFKKSLDGSDKPVTLLNRMDIDDAIKISSMFKTLRRNIQAIVYNYMEIFFLYDDIHKSSLPVQQKIYFIGRLDDISQDFYYFFKPVETNAGKVKYENLQYIKEFIMFDMISENMIKRCRTTFDFLNPTGFDYTTISEKYRK